MLDISAALKAPGNIFNFSQELAISPVMSLGEEVALDNVELEGEFFGVGQVVSIRGTVYATVHAHCARCLEPVDEEMEFPFEAEFSRTPDEDKDEYLITGHQVELEDAVREAIVLGLPLRFLCDENCKGLCPQCGTNLNKGTCACGRGAESSTRPNPFAALADWFSEDK